MGREGSSSSSSSSRSPVRADQKIWQRYMAPEGIPYYHCATTNETVWERPAGPGDRINDDLPPAPSAVAVQIVLWQRCCDAHGRMYYHCPATKTTVWEMPTGPEVRLEDHPDMPKAHIQPVAHPPPQYVHAPPPMGHPPPMGMPYGMPPPMHHHHHGMPPMMPPMYPGMPPMMPPPGHPMVYPGHPHPGPGIDVEHFIVNNKLDSNAAAKLRGLPDHIKRAVLERGDLSVARNPNAVLMGRIRDAEAAHNKGGIASTTGGPPGSLEQFIFENRIDTIAADRLRRLTDEQQQKVMERGNLTDARNPNAVLMGRIREATRGRSRRRSRSESSESGSRSRSRS
eukprot:TRINITY_DN9428_c0_g1_i1.p1 TRINITY_DN9428_c0_g1~~TRINITY_DN9428_c0_g1_i1.p1  ORF type:complete len:340 (-),score=41.89 TRINITY_DN9428_c0_g1_i1:94-1113(-)